MAPHIERYEIVEQVGRGGMATVYLARHLALDRRVALKQLHAVALDDPGQVERFLREARIGAALTHPNIVAVYDCFEQDGLPYIAMEYLPRGSLRRVRGPLTIAQVAGVLAGVLAGLAEAGRQGVVHRDLKPENLLITEQGDIKIADFGIAKAIGKTAPEQSLTVTGTAMGTPAYMAPEQALGQEITPRTDLYSLGVVAYELLTGAPPFEARTTPVVVLMHHVNDAPPDLRQRRPELDGELAEWVLSLLAKQPQDRPDGAADAWARLEPIVIRLLGPDWRRHASLVAPEAPEPALTGYVTYEPAPPPRPEIAETTGATGALPAETRPAPQSEPITPVIPHGPLRAVLAPDRAEPNVNPSEIEVEAGGEATLWVFVRNEGETVAHYALAVAGIPDSWWTASPAVICLNPWGTREPYEATIAVAFHPPRTPETRARRWPMTVTVGERAGPDDSVTRNAQELSVTLTIRPFTALEASLHPRVLHGRRAEFAVLAGNRGNASLHVRLSAADAEDACEFRLPPGASAEPGADGTVPATIFPRRPRWFGRPMVRQFEVTVTPDGDELEPERLPGTFHEHARFPWWLPRFALALLAAAAVAAAALAALGGERSATQEPRPTPTPSVTPTPGVAEVTAKVPNVVGLPLERARTRVEEAGLELGKVRPPDPPTDAEVRRQNPPAGTEVDEGSTVALVVETVEVPSLEGMTLAEAREALRDAGLAGGSIDPPGAGSDYVVSGQDPTPGERVTPDSEISLSLREPPFTEADALEVAQFGADRVAAGNPATAESCESLGGDRWACTATIARVDATGTPTACTITLAVAPSDHISAFTTESGRAGEARVVDSSECD